MMTRWMAGLGLLFTFAAPLAAHDTDQFSMPVGREMADLGPMLSERYAGVIQQGVDDLNRRIRAVAERDLRSVDPGSRPPPGTLYDPEGVLPRCHSTDGVAEAVYQAFGPALDLIEGLEREFHGKQAEEKFAGLLPAYKARSQFESIYNKAYSPIDPRNVSSLFHASTIRMFGVYLGTDKIGHFTDMGYHYFKTYRGALRGGKDDEQAMLEAVKLGTDGLFSERGLLGYLTAGSYSNADLVANYTGCLFYRNLTQPAVIKGRLCQPMLVRDGLYWKISDDLDPKTFFERFISDHLNEALNPSLYEPLMRNTVRDLVRQRNADLLVWYRDRYGDEDPAAYFDRLAATLRTYYGYAYGHHGGPADLIHLGNTIQTTDE